MDVLIFRRCITYKTPLAKSLTLYVVQRLLQRISNSILLQNGFDNDGLFEYDAYYIKKIHSNLLNPAVDENIFYGFKGVMSGV